MISAALLYYDLVQDTKPIGKHMQVVMADAGAGEGTHQVDVGQHRGVRGIQQR